MKKLYNRVKGEFIRKKEYGKKVIMAAENGNNYILNKLETNEPFFVTRLGATELEVISYYLYKNNNYDSKIKLKAHKHAGIFPETNNELNKFSEEYLSGISAADMIGVWFNNNEGRVINEYNDKSLLVELRALEPYYWNDPWSRMLEGKKVLVIHPFKESIEEQYNKRDSIFSNNVLVDFDLQVLKSVQSMKGNDVEHDNWTEALNSMKYEISTRDFDIAIIGAGAYGLPLGAYIKSLGKQAIHIGGATQILFGIKGARWDNHEYISKLYNKSWTRPKLDEVYQGAEKVEDGCYW